MVCDYFRRHEKHINGESYILRDGECLINMLVDSSCTPLFFWKYRVSMLVVYLGSSSILCVEVVWYLLVV